MRCCMNVSTDVLLGAPPLGESASGPISDYAVEIWFVPPLLPAQVESSLVHGKRIIAAFIFYFSRQIGSEERVPQSTRHLPCRLQEELLWVLVQDQVCYDRVKQGE